MIRSLRVARAAAVACALAFMLTPSLADAGDRITRGPAPAWVMPAGNPDAPAVDETGDGIRILLFDTQLRAERDQQSFYVRTRTMALSPQGLSALGNLGMVWSPASQDVTVHHVTLIRDGQEIDVLASQEFETLRREQNLDVATLDGRLTAILQPAGLRVGDILDVAYTLTSRGSVPGEQLAQFIDLNMPLTVARQRLRASWPSDLPVTVRAANNWTALPIRRAGGYSSFEIVRDNTQPVLVPADVPGRLRAVNLIELSAYQDWGQVATVLKPLYDNARRLQPDSPLQAEIARIRALSDDPAVQAAAALRLVQDEVRYVALLMGEGALTPATADETWARRFGDCKAKTALLLALLDGLGIAADPAAVSITQGDLVAHRLPSIAAFDHVIVRTVVDGRVYWLDGTRMGDRRLEDIRVPSFRWALPLVAADARLEALEVAPLTVPQSETIITIDASGGQHAPAPVTGSMIMRGDAAATVSGQLGMITTAQRDQGLRSVWAGLVNLTSVDEVGSTYDPDANVLTLTIRGSATLDWRGGLIPPGSTYQPLAVAERPDGPFKDAPFSVDYPTYTRQFVTVRLPDEGRGYTFRGGQFDRTELAHRISRTTRIEGDTATVEVIIRSLEPEISAAEAEAGRLAGEARPADYPRIIAPNGYRLTEADQVALAANTPTTAGAWLDRALALSRSGEFTDAVAAAEQAIALEPENSAAWANRGVYRFWAGDREGAAADLEKAVELDPSERIAMNGNALLADAEGRYQDVVIEMTRALRQAPTDPFALNMRMRAYMAERQFDRAIRDLDSLIAVQPERIELQFVRINALQAAGRDAEVQTALSDILQQHPDDPIARTAVATYQVEHDQPEAALTLIDSLLQDGEPQDADLLLLRAEALLALGRVDDAARDFAVVRTASGEDADRLNGLCWTAALAGQMLDQALQDCDAALALEPDAPSIMDSKARVLLQMGDPAAARLIYDAVLAKAPRLSSSLYGRGLALIALGETEAGEADKAAALEINPEVAIDFSNYAPAQAVDQP